MRSCEDVKFPWSKMIAFFGFQTRPRPPPTEKHKSERLARGDTLQSIDSFELNNPIASFLEEGNLSEMTFIHCHALGRGCFGTVIAAKVVGNPDTIVALKYIDKTQFVGDKGYARSYKDECKVLRRMNSPFILTYYGSFQTRNQMVLVTEHLEGGDLFTAIYKSVVKAPKMPSDLIRFYAASLVLALSHIHSKGVAYRDLKPENVMLDRKGYIRIIDFGFAKSIPYRVMDRETGQLKLCSKSYTVCGTPEYFAPEIIFRTGHDSTVDLWALGVLIFEMVMGRTPFATSKGPLDVAGMLNNVMQATVT